MKRKNFVKKIGLVGVMILSLIVGIALSPVPASAAQKNCKAGKCTLEAVSGSDYCSLHKCKVNGCRKKVTKNGYCSSHQTASSRKDTEEKTSKTCAVNGCSKSVAKGSAFCKKHTCEKKNCCNQKAGKATYCPAHLKKEMPDCDDYDCFEDFMDDWDGKMPDGSDAEDYWENW